MDLVRHSALAFLRLAIEQIRLSDPVTANLIYEHHFVKLERIFRLMSEDSRDIGSNELYRDITNRAIRLLESVKRPLAPAPGLGGHVESQPTKESNGVGFHCPQAIAANNQCPDSPYQQGLDFLDRGSASFAKVGPVSVNAVGEHQHDTPSYATAGVLRQVTFSSPSPPEVARRALLEDSEPLTTASRASSAIAKPSDNCKAGNNCAQLVSYAGSSSTSNSSAQPGIIPTCGGSSVNSASNKTDTITTFNSVNVSKIETFEPREEHGAPRKSTWASVAAVAQPVLKQPAAQDVGKKQLLADLPSIKPPQTRLSAQSPSFQPTQKQNVFSPVSRPDQSKDVEVPDDDRRVVWITNLPAHYSLYRLGVHINRGPIMSIALGHNLHPIMPGHAVCIIFREASSARDFCLDNHLSETDEYDPATDEHPAALLTDAPKAKVHPISSHPLDLDLKAMDAPVFARRRLKFARARLFYDVPMESFKRDIFGICGRQNVELFHFFNPGEVTIVFASVSVAYAVKTWFLARTIRLRGAEKAWDAKYEGVDVAFCKGFEEARPAKLVSTYVPVGKDRDSGATRGLKGLFMGPPVTGVVKPFDK